MENASLERARKKVQSKVNKISNFLKSQCTESSTTPPEFSPYEDAGDDDVDDDSDNQCGIPNLGNDSQS